MSSSPSTNQARANLRNLRMTPRKVRLVADLVRGLSVAHAEAQLSTNRKRAAVPLLKLVRSAIANARQASLDESRLFVATIRVDQGPSLKRLLPQARGRGTVVLKKMCHVSLVLGEKDQRAARFVIPQRAKKLALKPDTAPAKRAPKKSTSDDASIARDAKRARGVKAPSKHRSAPAGE